jgi:hypothetical protein
VFRPTYSFELVDAGETRMTYHWLSPEARRINYFVNQRKANRRDKVRKPELKERVYIGFV